MRIAIGSDHRGFAVKQKLIELLKQLGQELRELRASIDASAPKQPGKEATSAARKPASASVRTEVGGTPTDVADEYDRRSPLRYASALATLPVRLTWSPRDTIIPDQRGAHAHRLADALRARGGRVDEEIVTQEPVGSDVESGRYAHEACSVWDAVGWLAGRADR